MEKITTSNFHELAITNSVFYYPNKGSQEATSVNSNDRNTEGWVYNWIDENTHKISRSLIGVGTYLGQTESRILTKEEITSGYWWK